MSVVEERSRARAGGAGRDVSSVLEEAAGPPCATRTCTAATGACAT